MTNGNLNSLCNFTTFVFAEDEMGMTECNHSLDEILSDVPLLENEFFLEGVVIGVVISLVAYLAMKYRYGDKPNSLEQCGIGCQQIESNPLKNTVLQILSGEKGLKEKEQAFLDKVNAFLEEHLSDSNYNIKQLYTDMGMSRTSFYNKVNEITGKGPKYYTYSYKMRAARDLLLDKKQLVQDIATSLGFCDESHFRKSFKKYHQMSPTDYRKKYGI